MSTSTKCPQCGLVNWADAAECKRCNMQLLQPVNFGGGFNPAHQQLDDMSYPSYSSYVPAQTSAEGYETAGRVTRLAATFVDGLCMAPLVLIFMMTGAAAAAAGEEGVEAAAGAGGAIFAILYLLVVAILQLYFLSAHGQTIGKKLLGIRIIKQATGENGGFLTNVIMRAFIPGLIGGIPLIGPIFSLVDILFIFRSDKRCIHDLVAGTIVVSN